MMWTRFALWLLRNARNRIDALLVTTPEVFRHDQAIALALAEYLVRAASELLRKRKDGETVTLRCSVQVDD
jgi:hypothetical protein